MRLLALLSWYDEPPDDLIRCVTSLGRAGFDHLIAVDGAYAKFPNPHGASAAGQHAAIRTAAWAVGMALTMHVPERPWAGNEVEKRTFMHALALAAGGYPPRGPWGPWHFVIDADEVIDEAPVDLRGALARTEYDVCAITTVEAGGTTALRRRFFRAQPLELRDTHCTYVTIGEPVRILSDSGRPDEVEALEFSRLVLSHRHGSRDERRQAAKEHYYLQLPEGGHMSCERCGREATTRVRTGYRVVDGELLSDPLDVCQWCAEGARQEGATAVRALGYNPDRMVL